MLRHDTRAAAEDDPRQKASDHGVPEADPGRGKAVFPAKLTGIADEDNGREIGGAEGEGREPRAHRPAAENEAVDAGRLMADIESHAQHHSEENDEKKQFDEHDHTLRTEIRMSCCRVCARSLNRYALNCYALTC